MLARIFRVSRDGDIIEVGREFAGVGNGVGSGVDCAEVLPRVFRAAERGVTFGLMASSSIRSIRGEITLSSLRTSRPFVASRGATYGPCFVRGIVGVVCPLTGLLLVSPFMLFAPGDTRAVTMPLLPHFMELFDKDKGEDG